jgi:Putative auto-transporter adhesin, head GIN domain
MSVAPSVHPGGGQHRSRWALVTLLVGVLVGGLTVGLLYRFDVLGDSSSSTSGSATQGSGVPATQTRDVSRFRRVDLAGSNNVVIRVGGEQTMVVRADDNLLDRVTTEVRSGELVIANTPGSFTTRSPMSVEITIPELDALTLAGSGNIVVDGIDTPSLTVSLPGSGTLTGSGTATRLDVTVGGSGVVQLTRLVANDARAVVSGSGSVFVTATRALDASVSGSGAILYAGNPPDVTKSVTGSGTITGTS